MAQQVQRERHWLWSADAEDSFGFDRAFSEAKFWACGVYARTCDRLRTAAAGHNAATIHNPPCINADCLQIAACCPFYGCFIGKLQQRVRLFYGIDGCDWDDFWDACCCPCLTLVRSEQEIILRERLANDPGCDGAYQRHGPMTTTTTYTSPSSCCRGDPGCFTSCCRGHSGVRPQSQTRAQEKSVPKTHHRAANPAPGQVTHFNRHGAPEHINLRTVHSHEVRPTAERHVTPHRVEHEHAAAAKGKTKEHVRVLDPGHASATSEVSHRIEEDPVTTHRIVTPRHGLHHDPLTPTQHTPATPHLIHHDPVVNTAHTPGAVHSLDSERATTSQGVRVHVHPHVSIDEEVSASARRNGAGTH